MTRIKDIYAGMPDAKDEITTGQEDNFFASFVVPPEFPTDSFIKGHKYLVSGYKGVGKTSILYYLQKRVEEIDSSTCTSFLYFKSDFEEVRKSNIDAVAKKLTAIVDVSGTIQPSKVEYLHIWRWVFFKKIVDDCDEASQGLFVQDEAWYEFVKKVNRISFSSKDKKVISLSSLSIAVNASTSTGFGASAQAEFDRIAKEDLVYKELIEIVDGCENLFKKLKPTDIPYYMFVDEMEAYYGDQELFIRDLTLIRDLIFTIHRINAYQKVHIIAALRNEIIYAMDRFIQTREINKVIDGFCVPIRWSFSNTTSYNHPIIELLMKRITVACEGTPQKFTDWFPEKISGKEPVHYILDNGWNKPRDIVRLLIAAKNDTLHCNDLQFTQACFDTLRKEYSRNSLIEIRQELQSLYSSKELDIIFRLLRGGYLITNANEIRKRAPKGSDARKLWDERSGDILEDFYRVGVWGNINRTGEKFKWRWNHKGDTGVLTEYGWELVIHFALMSELSLQVNL